MLLATSFYTVVLAIHIMGVVIAFGVTFAYPFMNTFVRRADPRVLPGFHRIQHHVGQRVITPGMVVILVAGIYLASKLHVWGKFYVGWGMGVIILLGALGGMFFSPREARLAELAQRDIDATGTGEITFSAEYERLSRQVAMVGMFGNVLILAAIYFMTAQTGA